jgi:spore maturation protein SpmB
MSVLWEGVLQGLKAVWTVARVVIPLMIALEIAQANGLLQRLNRILARPFQKIGLSEEGAFPVVVAMVFGLTFGSGVIINHVREGKVTEREVKIMGSFIAIAHALIEDTIIFLTLGAPLLVLLVPRLAAAYGVAYLLHKFGTRLPLPQGDSFHSLD